MGNEHSFYQFVSPNKMTWFNDLNINNITEIVRLINSVYLGKTQQINVSFRDVSLSLRLLIFFTTSFTPSLCFPSHFFFFCCCCLCYWWWWWCFDSFLQLCRPVSVSNSMVKWYHSNGIWVLLLLVLLLLPIYDGN